MPVTVHVPEAENETVSPDDAVAETVKSPRVVGPVGQRGERDRLAPPC